MKTKFFFWPIMAIIILVIVISILVGSLLDKIDDEEQRHKDFLGTEVLYKGDTLIVVDYRLFNSTYTLDNGVEMNMEFVNKLPIIPK